MIYLDHNATTPVDPKVLEAMLPYLGPEFGNPSSAHSVGQRASQAVERARESVAALIGARASEVVFTSGGTEADNAAIFCLFTPKMISHALRTQKESGSESGGARLHVVTTAIEHDAVLNACRAPRGAGDCCVVRSCGTQRRGHPGRHSLGDSPRNCPDHRHAREQRNRHRAAHRGDRQRIAAEAHIRFHTDAVQSAGKIPVDVKRLGVDLLSLSAHKLYGPKGVGALFVQQGRGDSIRCSTAGKMNAGAAPEPKMSPPSWASAKLLNSRGRIWRETSSRVCRAARSPRSRACSARIPGARVNGDPSRRVPNTCNLLLPGVESESLVIALDLRGTRLLGGRGVLFRRRRSFARARGHRTLSCRGAIGSLRLSLGCTTTPEEIDRALELIPAAVARQRNVASAREMACPMSAETMIAKTMSAETQIPQTQDLTVVAMSGGVDSSAVAAMLHANRARRWSA